MPPKKKSATARSGPQKAKQTSKQTTRAGKRSVKALSVRQEAEQPSKPVSKSIETDTVITQKPTRNNRPSQASTVPKSNYNLRKRRRDPNLSSIVVSAPKDKSVHEAEGEDSVTQISPPSEYQAHETPGGYGIISTESSSSSTDAFDLQEVFYQRNGYLPPLDDRTIETIRVVLGNVAARKMVKLRASSSQFRTRLRDDRNVSLKESAADDPQMNSLQSPSFKIGEEHQIPDLGSGIEEFHSRLWMADIKHCENQNEALFQRTLMMAMADRYRLIFSREIKGTNTLAFSTEVPWTCPPVPTRGLTTRRVEGKSGDPVFLASPMPDLCVSFKAREVIKQRTWSIMPETTQRLICYEGLTEAASDKAFGFFVIEAKNSSVSPNNPEALGQVLNDASVALHNMYEFFKEADQVDIFFKDVRFFSAATTQQGIIIRIHRATKIDLEDADDNIPIVEDYPLQFEFRQYFSAIAESFTREKVLEEFERILIGYGEGKLLGLLREAAVRAGKKFLQIHKDGRKPIDFANDYRYGQWEVPKSKESTPASLDSRQGSQERGRPQDELRRHTLTKEMKKKETTKTNLSFSMSNVQVSVDSVSDAPSDSQNSQLSMTPTTQNEPNKRRRTK